ncbi:glycosyltransferase family 4 protein [Peribacillus psychrosaccharolyticus]|uniref:glycosyltransferase family 4 protein n=1 Tax=Peribacillus psychrosaccharolyticus TaxID=1407 RepID=UPI003D284DFE
MKVLMICTEKLPVPAVLGGAVQTYIAGILPHLSKNHKITVLGISDPSLPDQEILDNVRYIRVPGKILETYQLGVVNFIETESFDLIHIFNRPRLVLPVRKAAPHSKITLSMHNDMFTLKKIKPEEAGAVLEELSHIVTVSNYVGKVIKTLYPQAASKIQTVYSGVDTDRFLPGDHPKMKTIRDELRREHGLENKTVILFAGRLSKNKGVDRLIKALPDLAKKFDDLALVIVGSNWFSQDKVTDYIVYIRSLAEKLTIPVVNTGFVSSSEIQNWFAASDVFVCTSVWEEPLARVHYEAMSAGLPIVTTERGGNPEVIQVNVNGVIVKNPENPDNFTEQISSLLTNKSLMKSMGERGRELAILHYKWERVASEIFEVWETVEQSLPKTSREESSQETTDEYLSVPSNKTADDTTELLKDEPSLSKTSREESSQETADEQLSLPSNKAANDSTILLKEEISEMSKQKNKNKELSREELPAATTLVEPAVNQKENAGLTRDRSQETLNKKSTKYPMRWQLAKKGTTKKVTGKSKSKEVAVNAKENESVKTESNFVQKLREVLQNEPAIQNVKDGGYKNRINKRPAKYPIRWQLANRKNG